MQLACGAELLPDTFLLLLTHNAGILSSSSQQQRAGTGAPAAAAAALSEEEPLVLPLSELLAVKRCAEPSLPEGAGVWVSTQAIPTVGFVATNHSRLFVLERVALESWQ